MARTFSGAERSAITNAAHDIAAKLELKDYDGDWTDVSTGLGGGSLDWLTDITLEEDIDSHSMLLTATLLRDNASTLSLAPLRSDSTLNRDNSNNYQPFLDLARQWRVSVSVVAHGSAVNYKELGAGTYDVIDVRSPSPTVQIVGRDYGATLLDRYIEVERTYGDNGLSLDMDAVIQQVLDDHIGAGAITLYVPGGAPGVALKEFTLVDMNVMEAINLVASRAGMVCRYRYDASDVQRLTLYTPSRSATAGSEVWTLGPAEYLQLPHARLDLSGIRNRIVIQYYSDSAGNVLRTIRQNATSIARYGGPNAIPRTMLVDVSKDTNIRTSTRADALGDAILSDLAVPPMEQQFETTGFWIAQLSDYGKFSSNSVHYDSDQYGGVSRIEHKIANGTIRTTLSVRGQPAGKYRGWLDNSIPVGVAPLRIQDFRETARSTSQVTFSWTTEGVATELWLWLETQAQPVTSDPWPSLDTVPDFRLTAATTSYAVDIPVDGAITYGILVPVGENAAFGRPWQFTVQRQGMESESQGTVQISTTGVVRVTVDGPSWTLSHVWKSSTSDFPTEASTLSTGTTTNGRQLDVATGDTLSLGGSVYVTVIPFSAANAGGVQGQSIRLKATRHDATATKTVSYSSMSLMPMDTFTANNFAAESGYVRPASTVIIGDDCFFRMIVPLPDGVTLTNVTHYSHVPATGASPKYSFYRVNTDGTTTGLIANSTAGGTGWIATSDNISESTTSRRYAFELWFDITVATEYADYRSTSFTVTYTMPSTVNAI